MRLSTVLKPERPTVTLMDIWSMKGHKRFEIRFEWRMKSKSVTILQYIFGDVEVKP